MAKTKDERVKFPKKVLARVNECIYCGFRGDRLRDEHIVPFGLSGPWILEKASCADCARITSAFERTVLRDTLLVARAAMRLATYRPKQRPTHFTLYITRAGQQEELQVPVNELAGTAIMPILKTAAYLNGRDYERGVAVNSCIEIQVGELSLESMAKKMGASAVQISTTYHGNDFERMLAKIGLGFAIAAYGAGRFEEVFVRPSILGRKDDVGMWVGCPTNYLEGASGNLHEAKVGESGRDAHVYVRLFASYGGPWYQIVVGRLKDSGNTRPYSCVIR